MMRFASLGSGSAGNCMVIEKGSTRLMLDCGFTVKETVVRLARLAVEPSQLSGILVTHEHDDHAKGAFKLAARYGIPVWLSYGTRLMTERHRAEPDTVQLNVIDSHSAFSIGDIHISPYPVPHDAREPTQFTFTDGLHKLGVLTDAGSLTPHIEQMLSASDALVLECNHDLTMLEEGPYSRALKKRVAGRLGHLDNQSAAQLLSRIDTSKLKHMIAAHLSAKNNTQTLARQALSDALGCELDWIGIAEQDAGFGWRGFAV
jgi:phosphoribosyl 1,2-cyclic phosphodiesterase